MPKEIKGPQLRDLQAALALRKDEGNGKKSINFSASSTEPYDRWYGTEVLSHDAAAIRMERIKRGAVPLLFNHNWDDPIGMVTAGRIDGERLLVDADLFATARAAEIEQMIEGGLRNVSIGYRVHEFLVNEKEETYTATDWEPLEISIVTVPADSTVGIGRMAEGEQPVRLKVVQPAAPAASMEVRHMTTEVQTPPAGQSVQVEVRSEAAPFDPVKATAEHKQAIYNLCKANRLDERYARHWIDSGTSWQQISDDIVKIVEERGRNNPQGVAKLDLEPSDVRRYSVIRALRASMNRDWKNAGLELECNREISKRMNRLPRTETAFFVPLDVMMRDLPGAQKRDMTVAGVSGSNYLVGTENRPGNFIDLLRNTSVALRMGATRLAGLVGNVTIPKMTGGNTGYWLADETTQITESQPTIGQLSLAPKNVAALTELSHQLISQSSPDVEALVLSSIARDIGLAVDVGVLRGSGNSGQPTGIVNTVGIGSVTGTSLASAGILEFQSDVAANNALLPGCGYVTTPAVAALLMARPELPSTGTERLWRGNMLEGSLFNFPAMSSAQMSAATMLFGYWPGVILAEWGVLELMTNPFSDFTRGLTAVRGWYTCDVGVRYPNGFSYASSIT